MRKRSALPTWSDASARTTEEVLGSYEGRLSALRDSIGRDPGDSAAVARLARLVQIVRPEEAAEYYERYLEMNPGSREARLDLTVVYVMTGRLSEALSAAREQIEIWPDDTEAMYNLGAIYANLGDLQEARIWWERVAESRMGGGLSAKADEALKRIAPSAAR
jgi:tetratricopeptide (TPR) repeat protein